MRTEGTDVGATNDENHDVTPVIAIERGGRAMRCSECLKVRKVVFDKEGTFSDYPKWYQEGKQCPLCGAGFLPEIIEGGRISISSLKPGHSKEAE